MVLCVARTGCSAGNDSGIRGGAKAKAGRQLTGHDFVPAALAIPVARTGALPGAGEIVHPYERLGRDDDGR